MERTTSRAESTGHSHGRAAWPEQGIACTAEVYRPFKYEQLLDLTSYLEQGDWGTTTDATSGFHHLSLHPDMWEYAGFQAPDGQYYVFTVPAFGLVSAGRDQTPAIRARPAAAQPARLMYELQGDPAQALRSEFRSSTAVEGTAWPRRAAESCAS